MPVVGAPIVSTPWAYTLVDVAGASHAMNGEDGYTILEGLSGMLMPPIDLRVRELPLRAGSVLLGTRVGTREIDVPILIEGASQTSVVSRHEQLLAWLDPMRGSVTWRVTRPDATQRELICTYVGGLEGEEVSDNGVEVWWRGVATFRAHEPYWRDVTEVERVYDLDAETGSWFPMTFPIMLSGSQIFRVTAENNTGSAESYPTWTITGPGTNPVLLNLTTGQYLGLTLTLAASETITIDMAPLVAVPLRDAGGNSLFHLQTPGSERWPLVRGSQTIHIEMTGATSESEVTLAYRRRWLRR